MGERRWKSEDCGERGEKRMGEDRMGGESKESGGRIGGWVGRRGGNRHGWGRMDRGRDRSRKGGEE